MKNLTRAAQLLLAAAIPCATPLVSACTPAAVGDKVQLTGAGATFPAPLYTKWFSEYNKAHPNIQINYQSIGSGGGIKQIIEKTVAFGASDAPMTDAEFARAPGVLHFPTVLGSVVLAYNVPAVPGLNLSPEAVAGIFLGRITRWNDPAIAADNPGSALPPDAITVAHRSDGSGTTGVFTDYLAKVSPEWKAKVGAGKSVAWPVGLGGKGNEGVTGTVKQTRGAIGYIELAYANQNRLPTAALRNLSGNFVKASIESTSAAAAEVELPADYRVSITNAPGRLAYPISAFTYLLLYQDSADAAKGTALAGFLDWAIHGGQALAAPLDYAPLPAVLVARLSETLETLTAQGKPALAHAR